MYLSIKNGKVSYVYTGYTRIFDTNLQKLSKWRENSQVEAYKQPTHKTTTRIIHAADIHTCILFFN